MFEEGEQESYMLSEIPYGFYVGDTAVTHESLFSRVWHLYYVIRKWVYAKKRTYQ